MGQLGEFLFNSQTANIRYYGADFHFKYNGFYLASELYNRNSDTRIITNAENLGETNYIISGTNFSSSSCIKMV
ncbi:hypothetical protein [Pedobacter alpinus]|uniref:Uncharacterized protein n=1 Tax=Pedobacter alpinus TaxID=1590643 RepID=A0ABW5TR49_9SPHI